MKYSELKPGTLLVGAFDVLLCIEATVSERVGERFADVCMLCTSHEGVEVLLCTDSVDSGSSIKWIDGYAIITFDSMLVSCGDLNYCGALDE